jgi:hypothetical protein
MVDGMDQGVVASLNGCAALIHNHRCDFIARARREPADVRG